ncbi:MAG: hypothetical protein WB721_02350, partial [Pseudolabrys sp.]
VEAAMGFVPWVHARVCHGISLMRFAGLGPIAEYDCAVAGHFALEILPPGLPPNASILADIECYAPHE